MISPFLLLMPKPVTYLDTSLDAKCITLVHPINITWFCYKPKGILPFQKSVSTPKINLTELIRKIFSIQANNIQAININNRSMNAFFVSYDSQPLL
jgi:hypothetical protein